MAPAGFALLLCLAGSVIARRNPDVSCLQVDLDYVHCSWDGQNTEINYTFYSRFHLDNHFQECAFYTSENGSTTGCNQPYNRLETQRFIPFYTKLSHDNDGFLQTHNLKSKVKLYPPANVTVKNDSNNLCFYWNHTNGWYKCLENEVRYRTNNNNWESSRFTMKRYCSNLPSSNSHYELQVRFRVASHCGESIYWSDWSQPVYWGSLESNSLGIPFSTPPTDWQGVLKKRSGTEVLRPPGGASSLADVNCLLVDLDYVHCSWDGQNTEVNYTFYSRFHSDNHFQECTSYTSENGFTTGCKQPYNKLHLQRFIPFYTKLTHGNDSFLQTHNLKPKVKLYPPVNVTVKNDSNNLCFYWDHTNGWYRCLENEVRYRTNYNKWESSRFSMNSYCTNLPSSNSRYELQVRFRVARHCGESIYWSDWSQPVYWGSMEIKGTESSSSLLFQNWART